VTTPAGFARWRAASTYTRAAGSTAPPALPLELGADPGSASGETAPAEEG